MHPGFRSSASAAGFCGLLIVLLCLPPMTKLIGHPPREQAYAGLPDAAGSVGGNVATIFGESSDADVLFLGSSLVKAAIDTPTITLAMSKHLGRPARVETLGMNWGGLDLQFLLLRDYLNNHHVRLIVWNPPAPGARNLEPHIEAFHWVRYGEYSDVLAGLPLRYRLALYGDMVLGAPRELLSHLRPNLLGKQERVFETKYGYAGYYGASFVPESIESAKVPSLEQSYEVPPYSLVHAAGTPLNSYENHFALKIFELAKESHAKIALLHIPIDSEMGLNYIPERSISVDLPQTGAPMIGSSSATLFKDVDSSHFYNFYSDQHFNFNGRMLFSRSIIPAVQEAYDGKEKHE